MIYGVINTKGGVCKSTTIQILSGSKAFRKKSESIGIIEFDKSGTIYSWCKVRSAAIANEELTPNKDISKKLHYYYLSETSKEEIPKRLEEANELHDHLFLDIAGESEVGFGTKLAVSISDVLLIPIDNSAKELRAFATKLLPYLKQAVEEGRGTKKIILIPSKIHSSSNPKNITNYFRDILPEFITVTDSVIKSRATFKDFDDDGHTLQEFYESRITKKESEAAKKAVDEAEALAKEILKLGDK